MQYHIEQKIYKLAKPFTISRGTKKSAVTLHLKLCSDPLAKRPIYATASCVPYLRYGETLESVSAQIDEALKDIDCMNDPRKMRDFINANMPAGAARNAIDCALWDFEAKLTKTRVWQLAELLKPKPLITAYTLSLASPQEMAAEARQNKKRKLLKLKLAGDNQDIARVCAVHEAAPNARLIVDANEGASKEQLTHFSILKDYGVEMIEQPVKAGSDALLANIISSAVPMICADESAHTHHDLEALRPYYDAVNLKLDKTGGLTEAICFAKVAQEMNLQLMVGCMMASSLAMAPAFLLAAQAIWIDLDGPLLLAEDDPDGIIERNGHIHMCKPSLWG